MTTPSDAAFSPSTGPAWFGHPRPLARLFAIEMWERFGYYGMRALLMLYLTKHFLLGDRVSAGIYGGYTALVYLTPLIGGLLADQYLGSKRAVKFGAIIMAAGYFALALGGSPATPWATYDGARHTVIVAHYRDGPTSAADETRSVVDHGRLLLIRGQEDGSIDLVANDGSVARHLAPGALKEGADRDEWRLAITLMALSAVAVGNGFFKPNIATIVGMLYAEGDRRRDAGFTIFYMGINLGSLIGQMACPFLADRYGWGFGLGSAGAVMLVAWAMMHFSRGSLGGFGEAPAVAGRDPAIWIYPAAILAIPACYFLFTNLMHAAAPAPGTGFWGYLMGLPVMGKLLCATFGISLPVILIWSWRVGSRAEFEMMLAAIILMVFNTVFWSLFEQAGSSLTLFADRNVDRSVFGLFSMSAPQTQQFNAFGIITLAPVMGAVWAVLARRGWEPSIPIKFSMGLIGVGAGFLFLVLGTRFAGADYRVGLGWLAGLYLIHSVAELCISPVGMSMITKLSIARVVGLMMGAWYLSLAMGQYGAGLLAQMATVETVGGQVTNLKLSLDIYVGVFTQIGLVTIGVGLVLLALAVPIRRLMHGVS
jgi:POT family proton-dependent oligopeptide transporter